MKARRYFYLLLVLLFLWGCNKEELLPLCVLHTNDLHGHILPERVEGWRERSGGSAVLAGCVREIRAENERAGVPTLLLDAGDIFVGSPEGSISRGRAVVEVMNAVGYDASAFGNHEFDLGISVLEELVGAANFPFLGANIMTSPGEMRPQFARPSMVKEYGRLRVGVVGIATQETPYIVMPGRTERIVFTDPAASVRSELEKIRAGGANFAVVLSHCGLWEDRKLAREVKGIGIIVGGHSHDMTKEPVRVRATKTLVVQAGSSGQYLGKLDAEVDPARGIVRKYRYELIPLTEKRCSPEKDVKEIAAKWKKAAGKKFNEVVGSALTDIASSDVAESSLGNLITDSMRAAAGAEIAFNNSYGVRAPVLKGKITYRDIFTVMPFDNTLRTMKLNGKQIRAILERGLSLHQGILQFSGLTVRYDPSAPVGKRVRSVRCGESDLDDGKLYTIVTNSYLASGGDSYTTFTEGRETSNTGILDRDALRKYIAEHSPLSADGFNPSRLLK